MTRIDVISVLNFYRDHLIARGIEPREASNRVKGEFGGSLEHCMWMIGEAKRDAKIGSTNKARHSLGFIQGCFWRSGLFTIEQLEEHSRCPEKPLQKR